MNARIRIDQDAFCGEPLGAVACDGVSVIEMAMSCGVEFDLTAIVEAAEMWPSGLIDSTTARSRLATPSDLSGAVN